MSHFKIYITGGKKMDENAKRIASLPLAMLNAPDGRVQVLMSDVSVYTLVYAGGVCTQISVQDIDRVQELRIFVRTANMDDHRELIQEFDVE